MSAAEGFNGLPKEVSDQLKETALRVTQGFPAFRALRNVLTDPEWAQIEPDLQQYFPSPHRKTKVNVPRCPAYYAIKTLMKMRNISQGRAILELGLTNNLLTNADYQRLLREIGEGEPTPLPKKRPTWDVATGKLRFQNSVIFVIRNMARAKNQVAILKAFENHRWPPGVSTPLNEGQSTYDAVYALNKRQKKITFRVEHSGTWITWNFR